MNIGTSGSAQFELLGGTRPHDILITVFFAGGEVRTLERQVRSGIYHAVKYCAYTTNRLFPSHTLKHEYIIFNTVHACEQDHISVWSLTLTFVVCYLATSSIKPQNVRSQ